MFLFVDYLIPDTGCMYELLYSVPSFFGLVFRFVIVFLSAISCVLSLLMRVYYYRVPQGYRSDGVTLSIITYQVLNMI